MIIEQHDGCGFDAFIEGGQVFPGERTRIFTHASILKGDDSLTVRKDGAGGLDLTAIDCDGNELHLHIVGGVDMDKLRKAIN